MSRYTSPPLMIDIPNKALAIESSVYTDRDLKIVWEPVVVAFGVGRVSRFADSLQWLLV